MQKYIWFHLRRMFFCLQEFCRLHQNVKEEMFVMLGDLST